VGKNRTTKTQSSQSSDYFLINNFFPRRRCAICESSFTWTPEERRRKNKNLTAARLVAFLTLWFLALCPTIANAGHENRDVTTIAADRLKLLLDSGEKFILIDLRPTKEFQEKRLAGSRSIPVTELEKRLGEIPKSGRVVVYAAESSNDIPDSVFQLFEDERYKNITVMLEGFQGWEKRKFPLESGRRSTPVR
jgi:rhodanese-related sulfurtransferase